MEEIRQRLLESAGQTFADRGYRSATIREICQQADANVAAVNYYFGDKQQLYIEAVKLASVQRATQVPFPKWDIETQPAEKLRDFVQTILSRMLGQRTGRWESRLMLREVLNPTEACRELAEEYFRPVFAILLRIIQEISPDLPVHRCQQIGLSVMGQCLIYRAASEVIVMLTPDDESRQHFDVQQLSEHIAEFSLAALGLAAPFGKKPVERSSTLQ